MQIPDNFSFNALRPERSPDSAIPGDVLLSYLHCSRVNIGTWDKVSRTSNKYLTQSVPLLNAMKLHLGI